MKTNTHIEHILNICAGACIVTAAAVLINGCGQNQKSIEMGPGETVQAFYQKLAEGDIEGAEFLCDTIAMNDYISTYSEALNMLNAQDSIITAIALHMLTETEITIDKVSKEGDRRIISYTLESDKDQIKKKKATLKKEEGEWKVEKITDVD